MTAQTTTARIRIFLVAFVLLTGFLILTAQLLRWQVLHRQEVLPKESAGLSGVYQRGPDRGTIIDRHGQPLAIDIYRWEVWVEPWRVPEGEVTRLRDELVQRLGSYLQPTPEELAEILASRGTTPVMLTRHAPQSVGDAIAAWEDRPGIELTAVPKRYYPQHSMSAHLVGFVNDEPSAYYGVEQYYDDYLRKTGGTFLRSDPRAIQAYQQLQASWQQYLPSVTGQDLVLTIDTRIQYLAETVLADALGRYGAESGTIIVMDPHTGALLAVASLPTYDPNRYGATNDLLLADPALSRQYEPGSVFKIVTAAAAIDSSLIDADTVFSDTTTLEVGGRVIQNWDRMGRGDITTREALIGSRNIPVARIALMMGEALFYQYVGRFGFGQPTEVDLANESPGTVKVPGNPLWSESDLATNSFGQGLAVTPLQMAVATSAIANGGLYVRPHVLQARVYRGQVLAPDTSAVRRVIKPETAALMTELMVDVVEEGARGAQVPGYVIAGKTGTAQVVIDGGYHPTQTIASFVGFAPAYDPRFVALVKLDKPKANSWAVNTAAPTFAELAKRTLYLMNVPPDQLASLP